MQFRMNLVLVALAAVAVLVGTAGVAQADLVAHWTLDETSGTTTFDETPNNHDGTVQGGTTMGTSGNISYAYDFNVATNDGVIVPDADDLDGMTNLTLTSWIKMPSYGGSNYPQVMNKAGAWSIWLSDGAKKWSGEIKSGSWQSVKLDIPTAIANGWFSLNEWHQLAFVFEPAADKELLLYLDGKCRADNDSTKTSVAVYDSDVGLGVNSVGLYSFLGGLDDQSVWNEALSAAKIAALANVVGFGTTPGVPGLEAYNVSYMKQLFDVYDAEGGSTTTPDGLEWQYTDTTPGSHNDGDVWYEASEQTYYVKLGSGVKATIPEPSTLLLLATGLLGLLAYAWRKRK